MEQNASHQMSSQSLIEALVPGSSEIFHLISSHLNIDASSYVSVVLILTGLTAAARYCWRGVGNFMNNYLISSIEIRQDDEMYNYVMAWVTNQSFSHKTPQSVAGTKTDSSYIWDGDDDEQDEQDDGELDVLGDFDDYWMAITRKDKFRKILYTPSTGTHYFRYKTHVLAFSRVKEERQAIFWVSQAERLYLSCLGRDARILKELLEEAQKAYLDRDGDKTVIYRATRKTEGGEAEWHRCMSRPPRPLSTVVLDHQQKQAVIDDVKEYLSPLTRRWYANRGIPYRRGYLLYGPPGCGKSSLCFALAGLFHLKIYVVSLNSRSLTEDGLAALFQALPIRCIVLLEDIDAAGLTNQREDDGSPKKNVQQQVKDKAATGKSSDDSAKAISLSGLLNVIDGVASSEGRILVMTTNHVDKLDKALIRPGRVDMSVTFGLANTAAIRDLFNAIYCQLEGDVPVQSAVADHSHKRLDEMARGSIDQRRITSGRPPPQSESTGSNGAAARQQHTDEEIASMGVRFATIVPSNQFTPAEVQGYLLKYKHDPEQALDKAADWVRTVQEERRKTGGRAHANQVGKSNDDGKQKDEGKDGKVKKETVGGEKVEKKETAGDEKLKERKDTRSEEKKEDDVEKEKNEKNEKKEETVEENNKKNEKAEHKVSTTEQAKSNVAH